MARVSWLQRRPVWQKLALIVGTLVLPIIVLTWLLISGNNELINFAEKEREGNAYGTALAGLAESLLQHRSIAATSGSPLHGADALAKEQEKLRASIQAVDAVDQRFGGSLGSTKAWQALRGNLEGLMTATSKKELSGPAALEKHTEVMAETVSLFALVGETSNLLFDPALESYYLMDVMFYRVPKEGDLLGQVKDRALACAVAGKVTAADRNGLLLLIGECKPYEEATTGDVDAIFKANQDQKAILAAPSEAHTKAVREFRALVQAQVIEAPDDKVAVDPQRLEQAGNLALVTGFQLYRASTPDLESLLQGRIDKERMRTNIALAAIGIGMVLALGVVWVITRGITRQVAAIEHLFFQIGIGQLQARTPIVTGDEIGTMAENLNTMLDNTLGLIPMHSHQEEHELVAK